VVAAGSTVVATIVGGVSRLRWIIGPTTVRPSATETAETEAMTNTTTGQRGFCESRIASG
jgi:hypothetical protein